MKIPASIFLSLRRVGVINLQTGTAEELLHAVKAVLSGETFISQSIATKVISALRTAAATRETAAPAKVLNVRDSSSSQSGPSRPQLAILFSIETPKVLTDAAVPLVEGPKLEHACLQRHLEDAPSGF